MSVSVQQLDQPWTSPLHGVREFFRDELTLAPERAARMVRMSILAMLVVLISMALRVPEAGLSAYMIFFVTRDDAPSSVKSGIGLVVGAMYIQRSSPKVGPLGFAIGFVATMLLVYVDVLQSREALTRAVCWIWVVVAYPSALIALCEGIFGDDPEELLRRGASRR